MENVLRVTVEAKKLVPLDLLIPFQDELKSLSKESYERCRASLIKHGVSFALSIWQKDGKFYLLDGHQRVFTMRQMRDVESWLLPEVPVNIVEAADFEEAKQKVLAGASTFGKATASSFENFLKENEIVFESVAGMTELPGVDLAEVNARIDALQKDQEQAEQAQAPKLPSSSEDVKQVQLYFDSKAHEEFSNLISAMSEHFGTENITDTVMESLREAVKALD